MTIEDRLGYHFRDPALLQLALRHDSAASETGLPSQERLEFLGDSLLGAVIAEALYRGFPDFPEGRLALIKAQLVSAEHLAEKARSLDLGRWVEVGRCLPAAGRAAENLLADTLEAVLGAVFLDSDFLRLRGLILTLFEASLASAAQLRSDYKSSLQELSQQRFAILPVYEVVAEEGPSHDPLFTVKVVIAGVGEGQGQGRSKRAAGQEAAKQLLDELSLEGTA